MTSEFRFQPVLGEPAVFDVGSERFQKQRHALLRLAQTANLVLRVPEALLQSR